MITECRFKKVCEKKECKEELYSRCKIYKKYTREIKSNGNRGMEF